MNRPHSLMGRAANMRWLQSFRGRALVFGTALAVSGLLTLFPERHLATASFTPSDREALGLAGTLGQLGAAGSIFGNQAAVEVALRVGNSDAVRDVVIKNTFLAEELESRGRTDLQRYLRRKVEVRSLRGGIVLIEMQDTDPEKAREIVGAFETAIEAELARVARRQTAYKRKVLKRLVKEASDELAIAEAAYDTFRLQNRYPDPRGRIGAIGDRVNLLDSLIRSKEIALSSAREIYADRNLNIRQMEAELKALRAQYAEAKSVDPQGEQNVRTVVEASSELYRLERDFEIAKSLYNSYLRYLRGTAVEDLTADANMRMIEVPHVITKRQYWLPALALTIAILLMWVAIEAYRLRTPPGERREEGADV
jgi:uncharacterized protein involved in exopolysaccharide biosynthesis